MSSSLVTSPWGYRAGRTEMHVVYIADAATAGIAAGDMLKKETAAGYYTYCAAGDVPDCVAMDSCSAPTADGQQKIRANFSLESEYEYPPASGTVLITMIGSAFDLGGKQSVDISATTDKVLKCVDVDLVRNTFTVKLIQTNLGVS